MSSDMNVVQHNMMAMFVNRQLGITTGIRAKSSEKLSSGYKINRAADDAAGLSMSEKMRRQIRGLKQGTNNAQDGVSMLQIADGALVEVTDMLQRLNELAVKAANGTLQTMDRNYIQNEVSALVSEIDRVGATTTFNELPIFDLDIEMYAPRGARRSGAKSLTALVASSAADTGKLSEAYFDGSSYHPAASMDFSGINAKNVKELDGKGFSFTCAAGCNEVFKFTFDCSTNQTVNKGTQTGGGSSGTHDYVIGIKGATSGAAVVDALFKGIHDHPLGSSGTFTWTETWPTSIKVSHTNTIVRSGIGASSFTLYADSRSYSTAEQAKNATFNPGMGAVDCSSIAGKIEAANEDRDLWIQASSNEGDGLYVTIPRMNGEIIGVSDMDVSTQSGAQNAISSVKGAIETINTERALLGAQQNRLEHMINNNRNIEENTTASESRLRDTDMSEEMVRYSNSNIIQQAGQSMLAQANQSKQGTLSILQ